MWSTQARSEGSWNRCSGSARSGHRRRCSGGPGEVSRRQRGRNLLVPHFSNPYFYSDPTHRAFYGLYTFGYWVERTPFRRNVPQYTTPIPLQLVSARLTFQSSRPFYARHALKKAATFWVNWSRWTQEFYEENLTTWIAVYEIDYILVRQPAS